MEFDLTGRTVGPYQLHHLVGRGGMAWVYRATHTVMDWDVALKILDPSLTGDADFVNRFKREAKMLDQMQHPNIVRVRDAAWHERFFYIAMEYLDGESLDTTLARVKRLAPPQAINVGLQVAEALAYGHTQFRLIHRDIKPGNIFVLRDGSIKVLDFGVAVLLGGRPSAHTRIGTQEYMPYEQYQGNADERSDIYSLGATLYEAVTGRVPPPFGMEPPIPPRQLNPQVSPALEQALVRALQRDPNARFQTVAELGGALHAAWTSPSLVSPVKPVKPITSPGAVKPSARKSSPPSYVARERKVSNKALLIGGGLIAVLGVILLLASMSTGGNMPPALTRTPTATATGPTLSPTANLMTPSAAPTEFQLLTAVKLSAGEVLAPNSPAPVFRWVMSPLEAGQRYVVVLDGQRSGPINFVRTAEDAYQYAGSPQWPGPLAPGQHTWQVVIIASAAQGGDDVWRGPGWAFTVSAPVSTSTRASTLTPTPTRRPLTLTPTLTRSLQPSFTPTPPPTDTPAPAEKPPKEPPKPPPPA